MKGCKYGWMDACMHACMDGLVGKGKCSHKKSL